MAASVVGAFVVLDRASRPIRRIREEATKTDRVVARLGANLDKIGTREQRNRMGQVVGQMRQVAKGAGTATIATRGMNRELEQAGSARTAKQLSRTSQAVENTGRAAQRTDTRVSGMTRSVQKGERSLRSFGGTVLGARQALMAAFIPAIGLAAQGIGALAVGVGALLPQLTSFGALVTPLGAGITGLVGAMVTAKFATADLGKALGGNKEALKGLTPEARTFVQTLKQYSPIVKDLRREAQRGLFPGLDLALRRIVRAAPVVQTMLRSMGGTLGGIAASAARFGTRRGFLGDLEMLFGQGGTLLQRGARTLMNLASALTDVFVAAMPFTDWLSRTVRSWSESARGAAALGRETGTLAGWLRQARDDLERFGRIGRNVWGGLRATFQELRPLGDQLWDSVERITGRWADWAQSTRGRDDMRQYFAQMRVPLQQIAGLAGDIAGALGRLSAGRGFTASVRALRDAIPTLESGLGAMAEGLGPSIVGALSEVVRLFGSLARNGGALSTVARLLGGIAGSLSWLIDNVPLLGPVLATALSVSVISRFSGALVTLAGRWRGVGRAAAAAGAEQAAAAGGGAVAGAAGGTAALGAAARSTGRFRAMLPGALTVGAIGATAAGSMVGGGAGNLLTGAGTGAVIGASVGSVVPFLGTGLGAAIGAIGGGALGFFTGRSADQRNATTTGQDQALEFLARGASARSIRGRIGDIRERLSARRVVREGTTGMLGSAPVGTVTAQAVTGNERRRLEAQLKALSPALRAQERDERRQAVRAAHDAGRQIATGLAQAFNVYTRRFGLNQSMKLMRQDTIEQMQRLGPVGRRTLAQNVLSWAREQQRQNPRLAGAVGRLTDRIEDQFKQMGQRVRIVNGRIVTGTKTDWGRIEKNLAEPAERARQRVSRAFTQMQREAAASLTLMGFSRKDANQIIRTSEWTGGDVDAAKGAVASGQRYAAQARAARRARGGRIPGVGLSDSVMVAPGVLAAPGELIANRHTERRVDRMLASFGTSLGREIASENRPHGAALGARVTAADRAAVSGGRQGLQAGINRGVQAVLAQFPGLSVTSTTGGRHAANSLHYRGLAADIGGPVAVMNRAAAWIGRNMGASLLEGIHNPNLSIKNGRAVPPSFWGANTWAQHANHIHMAMGGAGGGWAGIPGGGIAGGQLGGIRLHRYRTGIRGVAGAGGDRILQSGGRAFQRRLNMALGSPGAAAAGGNLDDWLTTALRVTGHYNASNLAGLRRMALQESGGRPGAIQSPGVNDINMRMGNPARGLLQMIPQTFNAYALPGYGNIMNPVHNAIASVRYQFARYNGIVGHSGYALGGRVPEWGGWHRRGGRMRFNRPTLIGVGEGGQSEDVTVTPAGRGGQVVLNVHPGAIVIQGAGRGASDIADEVMDRLTRILRGMGLESEEALT